MPTPRSSARPSTGPTGWSCAANAVVADADRIRTLVTDVTAPVAELEALTGLGIETIVTGPQDDLAQDAHEPTDHGDPGRAG